jgi:histidine triad (HIT) family protein
MDAEDREMRQHSGRFEAGNCVFCAIIAGAEPASVVYDDAEVLGFLDIKPINSGHLLVIPKPHAAFLADLDELTGARMFKVAMRLAGAVRASDLRCEGVNLFLADGEAAGQEVFHVHLHVIPRFEGDSFRIEEGFPETPSRAELDAIAAQLRNSFDLVQQ